MNDRKLLRIILGILITVLLHNIYLNFEISQVKDEVELTKRYSSSAEDYAIEALNHAKDAADFARDAADNSREAADNVFANNCRYCP